MFVNRRLKTDLLQTFRPEIAVHMRDWQSMAMCHRVDLFHIRIRGAWYGQANKTENGKYYLKAYVINKKAL